MSGASLTWTLKGIIGEFAGNTLPLQAPSMTIGRTHQNHIVIPDSNISRHHATFFIVGNLLFVQDEKSRNGVLINDKKIEPSIHVSLKHQDRLHLGPHLFIVEVEEVATGSSVQNDPTREIQAGPRLTEKTQFQPTTLLKPAILERIQSLKWIQKLPPIKMNRRSLMYGVMGVFILMMVFTQFHQNSTQGQKKINTSSVDIEPIITETEKSAPTDEADIETMQARAKAALQFQDYLAATELYEKIMLVKPKDEYIKTQYEFSKKQLKRLIEKHLEFAKREYEKLNYERAIIEWKQVLALTAKVNPEIYQQTEIKIRDSEKEMQKKK